MFAAGMVTANRNRWPSGLLMLLSCATEPRPGGAWNSIRGVDGWLVSTTIIVCAGGGCDKKYNSLPSLRQAIPPMAFACDTCRTEVGAAGPIVDGSKGRMKV